MRSRTPLALMEQAVMLLVFIFATVLCVKVFAHADLLSEKSVQKNRALSEAKNIIEIMKSEDGQKQNMTILYDENWEITKQKECYELSVVFEEVESSFLWKAEVKVMDSNGDILIKLPAAGQMNGEKQ